MNSKEIVFSITKVHELLEDMSSTIEAIDIALFDLALQFADKKDFPELNIDEMRETMDTFKTILRDDDCEDSKIEDIADFLERCLMEHEDINIGDKAMILDTNGVHDKDITWVCSNIDDKTLMVKYAYGIKPEAKDGLLLVVGHDADKKCFYLLDEEKDECYVIEKDSIARYIPKEELINAIKAG